jgi:MoaA/NifB/PqqE/SkfB family radical SAM enzyme
MRVFNWLTYWPVFVRCLGKLSLRHLFYMARCFGNENPHRHDGRMWVNTFFPPYPSAAFDKFLGAVLERKRIPFSTYFAVTDECPYRCAHCSYGGHKKGCLDTEGAKGVIRQIESLGTAMIGFTGGEPLMRDDIVELVDCVGGRMASVMFTTGHGLDAKLASDLKGAGLDCLMIGVESDERQVHDKVRCVEGSFDEAMGAIAVSREAGIYTGISTVATRERIVDGTIERLGEMGRGLGVQEFRILEPIPTGRMQGHSGDILTADESRRMYDFHVEWNRRCRDMAVASFAYLESDAMFGCGAGYHHLFIDAVGNVCPCDLTPLSMGNVCEEDLGAIWGRMSEWFDRPRCGCFMKQLYEQREGLGAGQTLPVDTERSESLCTACPHGDELPRIYKGLFNKKN